jgi:hypothetical protein
MIKKNDPKRAMRLQNGIAWLRMGFSDDGNETSCCIMSGVFLIDLGVGGR